MIIGWIAASAVLSAAAPEPRVPPVRCDVTVEFKGKSGEFDGVTYRAVKRWLDGQPTEVLTFEETVYKKNSGSKFCIAAASDEAIETTFNTVRRYIFAAYSGKGSIKLKTRRGGLYQVQPRQSSAFSGRVPRDNGINNRPPIGNRN